MQKRIFFLTVVLLSVLYVKADDYSEWMSRVDDNVYISSKSLFGVPTRDGYRDNAATQNGVVLDYLSTHGGATDSQVTAGYATEPQYIWQIEEPPVDVSHQTARCRGREKFMTCADERLTTRLYIMVCIYRRPESDEIVYPII